MYAPAPSPDLARPSDGRIVTRPSDKMTSSHVLPLPTAGPSQTNEHNDERKKTPAEVQARMEATKKWVEATAAQQAAEGGANEEQRVRDGEKKHPITVDDDLDEEEDSEQQPPSKRPCSSTLVPPPPPPQLPPLHSPAYLIPLAPAASSSIPPRGGHVFSNLTIPIWSPRVQHPSPAAAAPAAASSSLQPNGGLQHRPVLPASIPRPDALNLALARQHARYTLHAHQSKISYASTPVNVSEFHRSIQNRSPGLNDNNNDNSSSFSPLPRFLPPALGRSILNSGTPSTITHNNSLPPHPASGPLRRAIAPTQSASAAAATNRLPVTYIYESLTTTTTTTTTTTNNGPNGIPTIINVPYTVPVPGSPAYRYSATKVLFLLYHAQLHSLVSAIQGGGGGVVGGVRLVLDEDMCRQLEQITEDVRRRAVELWYQVHNPRIYGGEALDQYDVGGLEFLKSFDYRQEGAERKWE